MSFIWLLFAHYIGDIALQPEWQSNNKGKYWYVMFCHCMIWTAVVSVALVYLGIFEYWKVIFLLIGHALMDEWRCHYPKAPDNFWRIYPDQTWHIIQLLLVYVIR